MVLDDNITSNAAARCLERQSPSLQITTEGGLGARPTTPHIILAPVISTIRTSASILQCTQCAW